jgi:hypothetical protein
VEELTEAEPVEDVEELADAEPVEDVEELTEVEPVEDVEELGEAEPVEELEELGDAEPVEELEELTEAEPVGDVEELADAEAVEAAEELSEAEPLEELSAPPEETEALGEAGAGVPELAEIGGVELTGEEIDKVMAAQDEGEPIELEELDEAETGETEETGEPEELEELEELADLEELDQPAAAAPPSQPQEMSAIDLANLASQIEFSSSPLKEEDEGDTALEKELEIVSPFATMLSRFSDDGGRDAGTEAEPSFRETGENSSKTEPSDDTEGEKKKPEEENERVATVKRSESGLETMHVQNGMSLIYKPFLYADFSDPRDLESLSDAPDENPAETATRPEEDDDTQVIEEHEGVHYINREILSSGLRTEEDLNLDFKDLVNSVIK